MNETMKSIVGLLEDGKPELQVAAAQVLGELRPRDAAATEALADGIDRSPVLGRFCLDALAKIGSAAALRALAEAVVEHEVLSEHAAQLLGEIGAPAHGVLAKIYPQAIGEQRARILGVLAREWGKDSLSVFAEALFTPDLTESAAELLEAQADSFRSEHAKMLRDALPKDFAETLPPACVAQVFGVLAKVDPNGSKTLFLKHTEPAVVAPCEVALELNRRYPLMEKSRQYLTFLYGIFDLSTLVFRYVRAGHPGPIQITDGCALSHDRGGGIPVGIAEDARYRDDVIALSPGDALVLYTDGVTETLNEDDEEFGLDRVLKTLSSAKGCGISQRLETLRKRLEEFGKGRRLRDDVTMVGFGLL